MKKAILFLFFAFLFFFSNGQVRYVDVDAAIGGDGLSWTTAFNNISEAITAIPPGGEIRVTVGSYSIFDTQLIINKNLILKGGFSGSESSGTPNHYIFDITDFNDFFLGNVTRIFGNINSKIVIDGKTANGGITNITRLENLFISSSASQDIGIEILGDNTTNLTSPTFKDCFFNGFDESAISINCENGDCHPTFNTCWIWRSGINVNHPNGGGINMNAVNSNSSLTFNNVEFFDNAANTLGGAIFCNGCDNINITDCSFEENKVTTERGGAISLIDCNTTIISNTIFTENEAGNVGGAIDLTGNVNSIIGIFDCTFSDNTATSFGGAIYDFYTDLTIYRSKFYNNTATGGGGGAILTANTGGNIQNSVFRGNNGGIGGNAIYSFQNPDFPNNAPFNLDFTNCSFNENKNNSGGGFACFVNHIAAGSNNRFTSCILWDNGTNEIITASNGTATLNHSILKDGNQNGVVQLPFGVSGSNNLDADPIFINEDLWIDCTSPAVDQADYFFNVGNTDIAGNNRRSSPFFSNDFMDIGAFEVQTVTGGVDFDFDGLPNDCDNCENNPNPAINFDGTNDYMNAVLDELGTGNQVHTIEAWVYIDELPSFRSWPLHLGQYDFGAHHWLVEADGDLVVGEFSGSQAVISVPIQQWTHIATVFDGAGLSVYKNGVLQTLLPFVDFNFTNTDLHLGKKRITENDFNGSLDEVRIWNVARTEQQIIANSHRELRGNETGLVGYYDFNEGVPNDNNISLSNVITDWSGNGNTGTLHNLAKTGTSSNWVIGAPVMHRDLDGNGYGDICECTPALVGTPCNDLDANTYNDVLDAACKCAGVPFSSGCVSGDTEQLGVEGDLNVSFTTLASLSCTGGDLTGEAHITYKQYLKDDWFVIEGLACNEGVPIKVRRPKRLRSSEAAAARNNYGYCFMETWEIENETCVPDILMISVYVYREETIVNDLTLNQNPIPQDLYLADNQITSQGTVAANDTVDFVAGNTIILSQGFTATSGSNFSAKITTPPTCNAARVAPIIPSTDILEQNETFEQPSFSVYPNPATIDLTINYQVLEPGKINLAFYSLSGQLLTVIAKENVAYGGDFSARLNVENYPKGLYFVQFRTEQTQIIKKVVIQ